MITNGLQGCNTLWQHKQQTTNSITHKKVKYIEKPEQEQQNEVKNE